MRPRRRHRPQYAVEAWITREFAMRGLFPPHCTPEALARALEHERQITIEFRSHVSDDPGVYGLLYRQEGREQTYIILLRSTHSLALCRLTFFHELAHILFGHDVTEVAGIGALRGYMVSDAEDAVAEAFAVGAMQYSFMDVEAVEVSGDTDTGVDGVTSPFGQLLQRTQYWP